MVAKKNIWNNWQLSLLIFFGALFILLFNAPQCLAGYVVADVDRASGTTDDQFVVTVVVNGKLKGEPSFPNVPGLKVVGTSKQSKGSLDVMRGSLNTELQFVFVVSPERTGTFTIPPFVLTVDGKEETTASLTLKVMDEVVDKDEGPPEIIVQRQLQKKEIYIGEALSSSIKVAHRVRLIDPQAEQAEVPEFKRISPDQQESGDEEINGVAYKTITLGEVWVAKKTGKFKLPGFSLSVRKPVISRGLDVFGLDSAYAKRRKYRSKAEEVLVKPLPEQGQPSNFSGIVGQFSMTAQLSARQVKVGDTINIQVIISGRGSAEGLPPLNLNAALPVRVYSDKPEYKEQLSLADGLTSEYKVSLALVPTSAGALDLGRLNIVVFNPQSGKYEDVGADLGGIEVIASDSTASLPKEPVKGSTPSPTKASVDPGTLKPQEYLQSDRALNRSDFLMVLAIVVIFLTINAGFCLQHFLRQTRQERQQKRLRASAAKRLLKDIDRIGKRGQQQISPEIVDDLARAFTSYLSNRWSQSVSGLTPKDLDQMLQSRGLESGERRAAVGAWEAIERARFSGSKLSLQDILQALNSLQSFVKGVENK